MTLRSVTSGEDLLGYIQINLLGQQVIKGLENKLRFTGREDELSEFFQELIGVNMVGRIVIVGSSIAQKYNMTDPVFEREFRYYLNNYFCFNIDCFEAVYRLSIRAVKASRESISETLGRRLKQWAMASHQFCYMCGIQLEFARKEQKTEDEKRRQFTCEHIWPREYGGNSLEENLLPCCSSCNSSKKQNFATWAMPSVQSLIKGLSPGDDCLEKIEGTHKFAIHYRSAKKLALHKRISLKEAFLKIGPWQDIRLKDVDDVADFFNLENHNASRRLYGI